MARSTGGQPQGHGHGISDKEQWETSGGLKPGRGLLCFRLVTGHLGLCVGLDCSRGQGQQEKQGQEMVAEMERSE